MTNQREFRATTDQLLGILDHLRSLEEAKRHCPLGSERFVRLATEAVTDGRLAYRWTEMQLVMAREAAARLARGDIASDIRLLAVEPRPLDRILALWREAQLRLEISKPGSAEAAAATDEIERLRQEYAVALAAHEEQAGALARAAAMHAS